MSLVWTSTMLDPTEVSVLGCLASHANDYGESCFAGMPRIAGLTRLSVRQLRRVLQKLEVAGWLQVARGNGLGNLTRYKVNVEKLNSNQNPQLQPRKRGQYAPSIQPPKRGQGDLFVEPAKGDTMSPLQKSEGRHLEPLRGTSETPKGDIGDIRVLGRNVRANVRANTTLLRDGAQKLLEACGLTDRELLPVVTDQLELETRESDQPEAQAISTAIVAMSEAWQNFTSQGERLRFKWGAKKFFSQGYWRNSESWPWDNEVLKEERVRAQARVGTYG